MEWDEPERGKHNGDHEGVQYFTCKEKESGSFIRPRKADLGITFIHAVEEVNMTTATSFNFLTLRALRNVSLVTYWTF